MWPRDVETIEDVPYDLLDVIGHANKVLDWFENLLPDDVPPEWMWPFSEEINDWFEEVKERKESEATDGEAGGSVVKNEHPMVAQYRARQAG